MASLRSMGLLAPLLLLLFLPGVPSLAAQEVNFSLVPTFEEARWDDAVGFQRSRMPGLRASIDFGPFFSLQPYYARDREVEIRSGLTLPDGEPGVDRLEVFGADLQVGLLPGPVVPFVKGGGGILRVGNGMDGGRDRILLRAGAGASFALVGRARGEVYAENWALRLSRPLVPGAVEGEGGGSEDLVSSLVLGAGLRIPFGGRQVEGIASPGVLPGFFVEPYGSQIRFSDAVGLGDRNAAGVRAGVDFNRNVGLRATYFRGVDDDISDWEGLTGLGVEAQFYLGSGTGLSPFLVAGAGRIRVSGELREIEELAATRIDHLTLGGGVAFALRDRVQLEVGARNLLTTAGGGFDAVGEPDELTSNWQYSAGLSLAVGGRGQTRPELLRQEAEQQARTLPADTSPRWITIPVPEEGEIILRFGEARELVRSEAGEAVSAADLARLEARIEELLVAALARPAGDTVQVGRELALLEARLPEMIRRIVREELQAMGVQPGAPAAPPAPPPAAPPAVERAPTPPGERRRISDLYFYTGLQFTPTQPVVGFRGGIGDISTFLPVELIPEIAFGAGEGDPSLLLAMNGRFGGIVGGGRDYEPYVVGGVSLTNRRFLSLNLGYGVAFDANPGEADRPFRLFVEHQGIGRFDEHRLLFGMVLRR